ncbi:MAG: DUF748 domain-containing protein [Sulfuricurvum sp.]|uniref:DUF748 domain-containing protein n=1 Tax=Sulfuricurvum sp. TaxID=2025608 RepID=UPI002617EB49|nr:DUF748 domain-containing protein [Sulfuricurvum sp.]MDD2368661.1 DUF748 domain-containing protein [Sulfuricurvum sp.]MDD2949409.1 DUF748 domain-containing protein [Sulfuricurvum sp.]MDD5117164.1 DUF748 domain-containing protein [Sulfuricurvum sp.]
MNKGIIFKSLAASVAIYSAAGFFGVPYLLKNVVPQKVDEATQGGKLSIESASFNPFTFHLKLKKLSFKTPQNSDFFALKAFSINLDPTDYLWRGGVVVKDIRLSEPKITIRRAQNGDFNFKWLTELGGDDNKTQEKPSEPLALIIKHFALDEGTLDYNDYSDGKAYSVGLGPIGFNLDNIDLRHLSKANGKIRIYATINEGGFLELKSKVNSLSPLTLDGSVAFDSGKLYTPWRYFKEKFPIEVADGTASFGFDYRFNSNDINATELSNLHFEMDKLRVIPKGEDRNLLTLASLKVTHGNVQPLRKIFNAESLSVGGINLAAQRSHEGKIDWIEYVDQIQKAFPEDENETKVPWHFALGSVNVENVGLQWNDLAPREPYTASVNNFSLHTGALSSDENTPLTLSLGTDAIHVTRKSDNVQAFGIEGIGVEGIEVNRFAHRATVKSVSISKPTASLKRLKDGSIDVTHYLYSSPQKAESEPSAPWDYQLDEISLHDGALGFIDEVPHKNVALNFDQLNGGIRYFSSDAKAKNDISLSTRVNEKGLLELKGDLVRAPLRSNGTFALKGIDLSIFDPYLEPASYASLRRGMLAVTGNYDFTPAKTAVKGKVALSDWVVNDTRDDSVLLGWQNIGATPFVYAYPDNRLKINQLAIDGFYTNALIDSKKVLNYSTLSKKSASDSNTTKSSGNPFGLDIVKLVLRDSSANFSDMSLPLPFKTYIHDLEGSVLGISTTKDVTTFVKLRGGVDQYGLAKIDGQINTAAPKKYTDIKVAFDNLELKSYTPYSLEFLGYKIDGGKLFLNLGYKIDQGQMNGDNKVVIKQIELGAEKEGGSPWPMRLVVALLEDSEGIIDVNLPVEGDVNKPDFKYGSVVWQVIKNLFTKAVTSPFRLLSSMLGIENDKLSSIDFEGGSSVLQPPQIEKLDQIAAMLEKRPKLSLNIYGGWDAVSDTHALKAKKLVQAALKRNKDLKIDTPQAMSLDLLEDMADDSLDSKELKAIKNNLEEKYPEEAAFVRHYSDVLIEKLIAIQTLAPEETQLLAHQRSEGIRAYLLKNAGLEKRLIVKGEEAAKSSASGEIPTRLEIVVP